LNESNVMRAQEIDLMQLSVQYCEEAVVILVARLTSCGAFNYLIS
jgi:hypothetical protein